MRHTCRRRGRLATVVGWLLAAASGVSAGEDVTPSIDEATEGLVKRSGLLDVWIDEERGKVRLELPPPTGDGGEIVRLLYAEGLASGLGSNPVGLDRGQLGDARLVVVRRVGGRILFEQPNLGYRASTTDPLERRAVAQSFATSVLWAGAIEARDPDGSTLVDLTSFLVRDAHDVVSRLAGSGQGKFSLDRERSVVDIEACLAFPDNLEFEALLTFGGSDPGRYVRQVTPTPDSVTLVQHHSLIRLPDDGYRPRAFDPRAGSFAIGFQDYAVPIDQPIERRWIVRHRLDKLHPDRERSKVREPIVYYVDPGVPEPIRSALVEGAEWWARAFEAAGFIDGYRVELLPEDAHPLDVRYNVIQWVHRSTRGWSYGGGLVDPRTGEMIKGHVSLGSLRVRQDRLLFEGLLGTDGTGSGRPDDPVELALARIRQLSAHEVGHTLGLTHNFAASTYADRASVMDYPAPRVRVTDGALDVSEAYGVGVGEWDVHAVVWAYSEFADAEREAQGLAAIVADAQTRGLRFITDADARPAGAAHPLAHLWDNGGDPVEELAKVMEVRRVALEGFGERNIAPGRPLALLEEVLAPTYLYHRYQLTAAAKVVGGMDFSYGVRGDGQPTARPVDGAWQRRALDGVLAALAPEALDIPESILPWLAPRPFGYGSNRELFRASTRPAFDRLGAAATAAGLAVDELLQPERAGRLVDFSQRDPTLPSFEEVLAKLVAATFDAQARTPRLAGVVHATRRVVVEGLLRLAVDPGASPEVRARAELALVDLETRLAEDAAAGSEDAWRALAGFLAGEIARHRGRELPAEAARLSPGEPPPGSPIGQRLAGGDHGCSMER